MGFKEIREYIINELKSKSLGDCYYHGVNHSLEVENACIDISREEGIFSEKEMELLRIAALSHDIGYTESVENHEILSVDFIIGVMPDFGFSTEDMSMVESLILVTKFPHKPESLLEKIICDADLSYLGTDEYESQASKLKKELVDIQGIRFNTEKEWIEYQASFLEKHKFFTKYACDNYDPYKRKIIDKLRNKLKIL